MLRRLIETVLHLRVVVLALALLALVYGGYVSLHVRLDVFPDFAPPQVAVQTEAPGLSAEQVEQIVTRPIEAALAGTVGLETLRSQSIQGLSVITAVFREDVEPHRARQVLSEQLAQVSAKLPVGVRAPRMTPLTSATMDLLKIGLVSDVMSPMELRTLAQWTLRPRLLAVPGVAGVSLFGGEVEQLQVQVVPARLAELGVSIQEVLDAARGATGVRGAGYVDNENQRIVLEAHGQFGSPQELGRTVLRADEARPILLGDVAHVVAAPAPRFGDTLIMGGPGVLMTLLSQYGSNTMEVTRLAEAALHELEPMLGARGVTLYPRLHRPATFIEHSLANMSDALALGAVLVTIVLFLFLYDLRTALISLLAIPLSLAAAMIVMHLAGKTLNTITLGGLVIALGEVVDDAIIDVENILRRLRENARLGRPASAFRVVLDASLEVRSAVVYATFVVALVFVPVLSLSGLQGRLFAPLGEAYLLAILASLVVALTVTPALSLVLLPSAAVHSREPRPLQRLRATYERAVGSLVRTPRASLALVAVLAAAAALAARGLGVEFLPEFREGHLVLHASSAPGTSLEEMKRTGRLLAERLLANPHIATVEQQIGRAELGEDPWGTNRSEFHVELAALEPEVEAGVADEVRATLASIPGLRTEVLTFLGDRIGETISGETASVAVSVFGDDLDQLEGTALRVADVLASVPGAADVLTSAAPAAPSFDVSLDLERLARLGLQPLPVLAALETAYQGSVAAQTWEGERVRDVVVVLAPEARTDTAQVGALPLRTSPGLVRLADVADLHPSQSRALVLHEGARRRATATCNVAGRDVSSFVDEARRAIARDVVLPAGTYLEYGGAADTAREARRELLLHSTLAFSGILLLLWMAFEDLRLLALVVLNLPLALIGGVCAARLVGGALSLGSMIGFVTLFGITTRNSIMLLSHYEHLVHVEGCAWDLATAVRGASERFTPILMTALVTGLGLAPLALAPGKAGREIEGPMAAVILGGLVTSTLLNLLVLPGLALRFARFRRIEPR